MPPSNKPLPAPTFSAKGLTQEKINTFMGLSSVKPVPMPPEFMDADAQADEMLGLGADDNDEAGGKAGGEAGTSANTDPLHKLPTVLRVARASRASRAPRDARATHTPTTRVLHARVAMYARVTQDEDEDDDEDDDMPLANWKAAKGIGKEKKKGTGKEKAKKAPNSIKEAKAAQGASKMSGVKRASKGTMGGTKRRASKEKEEEPEDTPEEDEPPPLVDQGFFPLDGKDMKVVSAYDETRLVPGSLVVQWFGKPYMKFFTGTLTQFVKYDKCWYIKFHEDNYRLKFDLTEANYMKKWAFIVIAEESQES